MTRRRQTRIIGDDRGGEFGPRTEVESRVNKDVTPVTAVKIPRAQAFWIALPLSIAVIVSVLSPIAIGPRIFWAVTGLCAFAAFLWSVQFEMHALDRITLPALVGIVAWCFWRFADFAGWRVPEAWQPWGALWALFALVFWWTFTLALWLTFVQRLGLPMFHQQFHLWKAAGNILEWFYTKRETPEPEEEPARGVRFTMISRNGRVHEHFTPPIGDESFQAVASILLDGKTFSEVNLCGTDKPLPGGGNGRTALSELRDWMIDREVLRYKMKDKSGKPIKNQGVSLTAMGAQLLQEALPPHPVAESAETDEADGRDERTDGRTND